MTFYDPSNWFKVWFGQRVCASTFPLLFLRFPFYFILFYFFSAAVFDQVFCEQYIHALFTDPTNYSNFFIKNRYHSTIYLFKNYFATVFYISVFSFSTNKLYPNGPVKITFLYTRIPTVFRTESMIVSC